jgi:hypothetical protein
MQKRPANLIQLLGKAQRTSSRPAEPSRTDRMMTASQSLSFSPRWGISLVEEPISP